MSQTIPTTINNRQKINNPPPETAADYLLTHNATTKETGSISKTNLFKPLQKQIDEINNPDGFLKIGSVNQAGNTVSIPALEFEWKIKPVLFFTNEAFSTVIAPATDGYNRIDAIVANDFGGFTKIQGNESLTAAIQPNRPNNSLPVTFITVFGANIVAIAPPTEPVLTLQKATDTQLGVVKLANPSASVDPVVYSKEDIDELLSGMGDGSIITTVKPILSTALTTQNVAGFVTYINALNPFLVVTGNEIVKFNTTDTGRVFELKLRGRSFGTGQAAIVAADVLEVTEFLNKDIKLSNYPSSRNDGQLPTNRVFSPDANGSFKLFTIATAPAPYIAELIPDSYLPSTTGNIRILGDFFIPVMCDRVNNASAIVMGGVSVINYATFVSSKEILVNVTTGSVEGNFSITLNNGLSTTKNNALLIVQGLVVNPIATDWTPLTGAIDVSEGTAVKINLFNAEGTAVWNKPFLSTKNYKIAFRIAVSPLGNRTIAGSIQHERFIYLRNSATKEVLYELFLTSNPDFALGCWAKTGLITYFIGGVVLTTPLSYLIEFKKVGTIMYVYIDGVLVKTFSSDPITVDLDLLIKLTDFNISNIKYIEIA